MGINIRIIYNDNFDKLDTIIDLSKFSDTIRDTYTTTNVVKEEDIISDFLDSNLFLILSIRGIVGNLVLFMMHGTTIAINEFKIAAKRETNNVLSI